MAKVLIVDDDVSLCRLLKYFLEGNSLSADCVHNAKNALSLLLPPATHSYDMLVLDVLMPDGNGLEVLKTIRAASFAIPVIMLTSCDETSDKIAAFKAGADDYLCKPFDPRELLERIYAVLRRSERKERCTQADTALRVEDIELDETTRTVKLSDSGKLIELTGLEFRLLDLLVKNAGRPVSLEELYAEILRRDYNGGDRSLSKHVSNLRQKLEKLGASFEGIDRIKTLRGKGFMFIPLFAAGS